MEETPKKGFVYWFVNVFWYHYGKLSILVLFLAAAAIWMTVDLFRKEEYDLNVAVVSDEAIARSDAGALAELFAAAAGDVNGDGKALVNVVTVAMEDEERPETGRYQALLYLSLPEYTIFLMNEQESARYVKEDETFQLLGDYGIETEDESGRRVWVGDKAVIQYLGDHQFYACLADWTVDGKGSPEMTAAAVRALKALLASPDADKE
jgi:hypothetical protein